MLSYRRTAVRRNVIVNTKTDKAFRGILWAKTGPLLVLRGASLLAPGQVEGQELDGEVVLERINVDFIQVLP